jgi:uncharacterized tellurite resistance protein B-like protein
MLVVPCRRTNSIWWPNRTTNALIGRPIHEPFGNRAVRCDDKAKRAMLESILSWLNRPAPAAAGRRDELQFALAALLVEAGFCDDRFDDSERAVIARLLERRFNLTQAAARLLLTAGEREAERSAQLFHLTRIVNERLSHPQRIELIEMLWEVVYADGVLDQYEDSLLRRIGGLVYVSDRERSAARQRVSGRYRRDRPIRFPSPAQAVLIQEKKSLP